MKEVTSEALASCNGKDGNPVYIAFQGKVYDVSTSRLWSKGTHMNRHPSGKDLTPDLSAAPHGPEVFERYPQVGLLKKGAPEELKHLPVFLQTVLERFPMAKRHPHPVMVHFPIAFIVGASLFLLLHLFFQKPSFLTTSYSLLVLGTVASPFAVATGLFTWWINYRAKQSRLIKRKIEISAVLLIFEIILLWWGCPTEGVSATPHHPLYVIMTLSLTPIVLLLGYYGGQMTFPAE